METEETIYISCACNRLPHSADWGKNGLICYAACNAVAICDPEYGEIGRVTKTLHAHNARVNVVRWIKKSHSEAETELLSASSDGSACIWSATNNSYALECKLQEGNPLTIADGIYLRRDTGSLKSPELLICLGSSEGTFSLWMRDGQGETRKIQNLTFGRKIATQARLSLLPNSETPLVAVATDDCHISIYCSERMDGDANFVQCQTLQNHEDWITCMDFVVDARQWLHLATGSQDSTIRLWKICESQSDETAEKANEIQRRIKRFSLGGAGYEITLESILSGHEHWVYGVNWNWQTADASSGVFWDVPALLSCAMDGTMIIWEAQDGGVWRETVRVGEVGGNSLGFYGCKYAPDGRSILAHGRQGSFHLWTCKTDRWIPRTGPTGHFSGVVDLCWDPRGRFLMSASDDQTTRIHAPWVKKSGNVVWHEIGRPQVHGYDMSCLAMLGPYTFASGADEKVVRIFGAPRIFEKYLATVADTEDWDGTSTEGSASVPALGLTNKMIFDDNTDKDDTTDLDLTRPPTEEELIRHTLWPELQKLYGHGYGIFSVASRTDGSRFATACKSASADHSAIIIWCTKTWSQVQKIASHRLTVTQMAFSPDNEYLLSVSRDRRWALHRRENDNNYEIVAGGPKLSDVFHSRIIWCCAWTHDSKYFCTGSRDGQVALWSLDAESLENGKPIACLKVKDASNTAVAFVPYSFSEDSYVLAIGHDEGHIEIYKIVFTADSIEWRIYKRYDTSKAHHSTVTRLAFRPNISADPKSCDFIQLASCAMDNTLKIHNLSVSGLQNL